MTSEELSGVYTAEIKDDLEKGEVGRKPSEVIVSGNALFYFRSYGQEENSAEMWEQNEVKCRISKNVDETCMSSMYVGMAMKT